MSINESEYSTERVPPEKTGGWIAVALVSAMVAFSLPTFVAGVELFAVMDNRLAIMAVLLGGAILTVIGALMGAIGSRTRLSSYLLVRVAFGNRGAAVANLAFAISLLGWFGFNINLFSITVVRLFSDLGVGGVPVWVIEVFAGGIMTVTTLFGFRAINRLSMVLTPVLMLVTALLVATIIGDYELGALIATSRLAETSFGDGVSSVVGGIIVGAIILPDITRFIRDWRGAVYTAVLSYLVVGSIVMIAGGLVSSASNNPDFLDVMISVGLGWAAFAIVIAGSWVLNALNLYSTALSTRATFPTLNESALIVVLGIGGTVAAFANIIDAFLDFLFYLSVVFVPVAGVIIIDYWRSGAERYESSLESDIGVGERPVAMISWVGGAVIALLAAEGYLSLSGIAALDAMLCSAVLFALLSLATRRRDVARSAP
ncbi:MAG: cytosine permease [Pseudomonadota bacterium]